MEQPEFVKNDFTKYILESLKSNENIHKRPGFKPGQNNSHLLTTKERYRNKNFDLYTRLANVLDQLDYVAIFLKRLPHKEYLKTNGLNELNFLQYHLEAHVHKIHTVLELMRLMVNSTYEFGILEKDCSWENLKKHPGIKNSAIEKILNGYYKTFKGMIEMRHYNTHRGLFKDSAMEELSSPLFIYDAAAKFKMDITDYREVFPEFYLRHKLKKLRKDRIKNTYAWNHLACNYTNKFLDALLPTFKSKLEALE